VARSRCCPRTLRGAADRMIYPRPGGLSSSRLFSYVLSTFFPLLLVDFSPSLSAIPDPSFFSILPIIRVRAGSLARRMRCGSRSSAICSYSSSRAIISSISTISSVPPYIISPLPALTLSTSVLLLSSIVVSWDPCDIISCFSLFLLLSFRSLCSFSRRLGGSSRSTSRIRERSSLTSVCLFLGFLTFASSLSQSSRRPSHSVRRDGSRPRRRSARANDFRRPTREIVV